MQMQIVFSNANVCLYPDMRKKEIKFLNLNLNLKEIKRNLPESSLWSAKKYKFITVLITLFLVPYCIHLCFSLFLLR